MLNAIVAQSSGAAANSGLASKPETNNVLFFSTWFVNSNLILIFKANPE
jgi:hypothetical protein